MLRVFVIGAIILGRYLNVAADFETTCTAPDAPEHGTVKLSVGTVLPKAGTFARYSCDDGFTLDGFPAIICRKTGVWMFPTPKCLKSCYVSKVQNGEIGSYFKEVFSLNSEEDGEEEYISLFIGMRVFSKEEVTLVCDQGYFPGNQTTTREIKVTCNDGKWSAPLVCQAMSCMGEPPAIENGSPIISSRVHGFSIWYKCDPGYERASIGNVVCKHGKWEGPTPICADNSCYVSKVQDGEIGRYIKDDWLFSEEEEEYVSLSIGMRVYSKEEVTLLCDQGYFPGNQTTTREIKVTCNDGKWSAPLVCLAMSCMGEPSAIENGSPIISSRVHGFSIWYKCDTGYEKTNTGNVVCKHGIWEGPTPVCSDSITACRVIKDETSQLIVEPVKDYYSLGDIIVLSCPPGHKLTTRVQRMMCLGKTWSDMLPNCMNRRNIFSKDRLS